MSKHKPGSERRRRRQVAKRRASRERRIARDFVLVPIEPTAAMLDRAVAFALNVTLSGDYNWSAYMRDVYRTMLAGAPSMSRSKINEAIE